MSIDGGGGARQASVDSGVGRVITRAGAVACWLCALVVPAVWYSGDFDWSWWAVLAGIGGLLVTALVGASMWSEANRAEADTTRLRQAGRPAVAEIVGMDVVYPDDGPETSVLRLRISGDDIPAFDATYRCEHEPGHRVGAHFTAVVDPSDNLFTLDPVDGPR